MGELLLSPEVFILFLSQTDLNDPLSLYAAGVKVDLPLGIGGNPTNQLENDNRNNKNAQLNLVRLHRG